MRTSKLKIGEQVLIIEDIREGGNAKGQTATYEGDFPHSVALSNDNGETWLGEFDYDAFMGRADLVQRFPLWEGGEHGMSFAMPMDNPRFILADGSKIWGAECWWTEHTEKTLSEAETRLEEFKDVIRHIAADPNPSQ